MNFIWEQFNIKTFPARPVVFVGGVYNKDLSDENAAKIIDTENTTEIIPTDGDLPVHIICVGEISGDKKIIIKSSILNPQSSIYFSLKAKNKTPAVLDILCENTGKNSEIIGDVVIQNYDKLKVNIVADNLSGGTGVFIKTRILAHENTDTELMANANIVANAPGCKNDISFSVMAADGAKIKMTPAQKIHSVPTLADHAASIYRAADAQIEYLASAGMSPDDIKNVLEEAFLN
ncbi:MAG: SufD family Fe-S cluster assembly protein [Alphaproteobacteria bacterium]|nr:SufD family Fe-S cluster assembly protein [Alphaproteobacteria bacterium]